MAIEITVFDPGSRSLRAEIIEANEGVVRLRALDGSSAFHLFLKRNGGQEKLRLEVPTHPAEEVVMQVQWGYETGLTAKPTIPRPVKWLPPEAEPLKPIVQAATDKLDLVLLLDGTSRWLASGDKQWPAHLDRLVAFAEQCALTYPNLRTACVAFGDEPMEEHLANADDLLPGYVVRPGVFEPFNATRLRSQLGAVKYTSGGDYVDALADGLRGCRSMYWRDEARRVVLVSGDSPGHRLLDLPNPDAQDRDHLEQLDLRGIDARARMLDIDEEVAALQDPTGVEILSVFLGEENSAPGVARFVAHTREQYRIIASLPEFAWTAQEFEPVAACEAANRPRSAVGRGANYPELVSVA